MGKRPPCVLYQSFLGLSVFVHDAPNKGTHPPAMHFASWESHPSQDLCEVLSLVATAHGTFLCRFNARPVTEHKYHYCFCLSWPSVRMRRTVRLKRSCGLSALADGRRKVKNALCYSVFKERAEAIEKAPSLFMVKSEGAYNRNFYFSKRFLSFTLILAIRLLIAC